MVSPRAHGGAAARSGGTHSAHRGRRSLCNRVSCGQGSLGRQHLGLLSCLYSTNRRCGCLRRCLGLFRSCPQSHVDHSLRRCCICEPQHKSCHTTFDQSQPGAIFERRDESGRGCAGSLWSLAISASSAARVRTRADFSRSVHMDCSEGLPRGPAAVRRSIHMAWIW